MNASLPFPEPIRLTPELRRKLETAVDQILALLDATAPDPDLEPSLGSIENHSYFYGSGTDRGMTTGRIGDQTHWAARGIDDDLEDEADGSEPSLGWTATINQAGRSWAGGLDGAEAEHDGREPDTDCEPSLGWSLSGAIGGLDDRELEGR